LRERIEKTVEETGIEVSAELHADLVSTMEEHAPSVKENYPPASFLRLFWEQQQRASSLKNSKSMKWSAAMIRYFSCMYMT